MFSGFDNFTEGLKRFSLDALQEQEEQEDGKRTLEEIRMPVLAENTTEGEKPPPRELQPPPSQEYSEWDWDEDNTSTALERKETESVSQQRREGLLERSSPKTARTAEVAVASSQSNAVPLPVELVDRHTPHGSTSQLDTGGAVDRPAGLGMQVRDNASEERREGQLFQEEGLHGLAADDGPMSLQVEEGLSKEQECGDIGGSPTEDDSEVPNSECMPTTRPSIHGNPDNTGSMETTKDATSGGIAVTVGATPADANGRLADSAGRGGGCEQPEHLNGHQQHGVQRQRTGSSTQESVKAATVEVGSSDSRVLPANEIVVDSQALNTMRQELDFVQHEASRLESALRESQSNVQHLRKMLAIEEDKTRRQAGQLASLSDEVNLTRMGFQESNAAHQRTAERSHALEEELLNTRKIVDTLRAESAALEGQVKEASENQQSMEDQLRHLQAGLSQGQEAARQEAKQEVERLEARLKDALKDRDRKQAELDLQNARRKETREMARDLETQLSAVERIAQEREVELNTLKDQMVALRKNTGEAMDQKNTWAKKYEALELNFKQVRAQSKRVESELEDLRQNTARIETEKAVLEERVEVEGAERVTVVASVSHERDFLLRQVDRLEKEVSELRRAQEEQAVAAAARARTTGVLEEYKARTQQALRRANEITSQTASENKRLQAEIGNLSAEMAQQRPLWERSKQLEEAHHAEVAELKELIADRVAEANETAAAKAAVDKRLAEEEEERRNAHTSVLRLEAQGKSLKQELHRQQKALAAAQEKSVTLQKKLAEQEVALQATEDSKRGKSPLETEIEDDMLKHRSSPQPAAGARATPLGLEEGKRVSCQSTPRGGMGSETAGAAMADGRHSLGESYHSIPSEENSVDASQGSVGEQLFYVHQLRERMSKEQVEMRSLISELEASRTAADAQAAKQAQLEKQLEAALLDKKRLQDLDSGRNAAVNLTYLKNCVVGCLRTSEPSEHARLLPVITTILKLSQEESAAIAKNISTRAQHQGSFGGSLPQAGTGDARGDGASSIGNSVRSWWTVDPPKK